MNNKKEPCPMCQANHSKKQHQEPWMGNPDDHEPTRKVEKHNLNP